MNHSQAQLNTLHRPKLLIRAARAGMQEFRGARDLRMIKGVTESMSTKQLLDTLLQNERLLNEERIQNDAAYSVRKHIRVLTALMFVANGPKPIAQAA